MYHVWGQKKEVVRAGIHRVFDQLEGRGLYVTSSWSVDSIKVHRTLAFTVYEKRARRDKREKKTVLSKTRGFNNKN
jgi:hypothetical protein